MHDPSSFRSPARLIDDDITRAETRKYYLGNSGEVNYVAVKMWVTRV